MGKPSLSGVALPRALLLIQSIRYDLLIRSRGIHRHNPQSFTNFVAKKTASVPYAAMGGRVLSSRASLGDRRIGVHCAAYILRLAQNGAGANPDAFISNACNPPLAAFSSRRSMATLAAARPATCSEENG